MSAQQKEDRLFENIYLSYFPKMKRFAQEYVISEQDAENIVQDMFAELWVNPAKRNAMVVKNEM